ncbi:YdcF family protein [Clostridium baratii]|uniref:YdcF family protein n=1 Tax=Clostridium baratii TaxID=1561 RepID=UPI003D34AEE4
MVIVVIFLILILKITITHKISKPKRSDVIIILGCNLNSIFMTQRLKKGEELYKENMGKYIIVTGKGTGLLTEGEGMKNILTSKGVDENIILVENNAKNTYENLKFSKDIMDRKKLSSAIIVSDSYHLARIKMIAKNIGMEATVYGEQCKYYSKYEIRAILREIPAYIKDFFISKFKK